MAVVKPFPAIRPQAVKAAQIAALPYDVFTREEAKEEVKNHPLSFLKVDRPETEFPENTDMYSPEIYQRARENLWKLLDKGELCQDMEPCYYIYELDNGSHVQTGVAACVAVDDYLKQTVKRHENTRQEKEADRIRHIQACKAQTGPIYLTHRPDPELRRLLDIRKSSYPTYNFLAEDGVRHRVWVIYQGNIIEKIQRLFEKMDSIYIADGHHRAAAAVKTALERREKDPSYTGKEPYNYVLSVLFPWDELRVVEYNRVVKDLGGKTAEEFLAEVRKVFLVEEQGNSPVKPEEKGVFGLYVGKKWYKLRIQEAYCSEDAVKGLDVSLLQDWILGPVLGIQNPREDSRLEFEGGVRGIQVLEEEADQSGGAAFTLYPTSIEELIKAADQGRLMPPKSTWFEPKLRSGLFIHRI